MSKSNQNLPAVRGGANALELLAGDPSSFAPVRDALQNLAESEEFSAFDFTKLRVPAGGSLRWEFDTIEGTQSVESIRCIIVAVQRVRQYWSVPIDKGGGDAPPDCVSPDGKVGYGAPGGECQNCPLARWGSAQGDGRGQACSERRHMLLLTEYSALPMFLNLPPTSLGNWKSYALNHLAGAGLKPSEVVTELGLERRENNVGIKYAVATFKMIERLTGAAAANVAEYQEGIEGLLSRQIIAAAPTSGLDEPLAEQ